MKYGGINVEVVAVSLHPCAPGAVPALTAEVARQAFPDGCLCTRMRDALGPLFRDEEFTDLYPARGRPAWSPAQLAAVCVLQFLENLSDRQAAAAVRGRIDWKYLLGLELTDAGFDHSVLSEFRDRTAARPERLLEAVLERMRGAGLLARPARQRTDSTHVLAAVRRLNRLENTAEHLRAALNALAAHAPAWLGEPHPPRVVRPLWAPYRGLPPAARGGRAHRLCRADRPGRAGAAAAGPSPRRPRRGG